MIEQILSLLPAEFPWRNQIQHFDTITSTNDVLKQMANQGCPAGTVLIADQQTGGRGRLGRSFHSPPKVGIYISFLLRPDCTPDKLMHLTCATANAVCDAIAASAGFRPGIKWTNDIVCNSRKLSGILTEMKLEESGKVDYAVIGVGINCSQTVNDFPEEIRSFAGSLEMITGSPIDRARIAAEMILAFQKMDEMLLTGKHEIMEQYRRNCITLGNEVRVVRGVEAFQGMAADIDEEGALLVRKKNGEIITVNSGEVSVRGLYGYV